MVALSRLVAVVAIAAVAIIDYSTGKFPSPIPSLSSFPISIHI